MIDLFSGIGGFHLAADWVWGDNLEVVAHCEIASFPQKVLKKHWPDVPIVPDIRNLNGAEFGTIDLITGGFPCQPYSVAGKQGGADDDRALWPEMFRIIKEARPRWIIGENVPGIIKLALDDVLASLESEGYSTRIFNIPACAVEAPHERQRIWIIANNEGMFNKSNNPGTQERQIQKFGEHTCLSNVANAESGKNDRRESGKLAKEESGRESINATIEPCYKDAADSNEFNDDISGLRTGEIPQFKTSGIFENTVSNANNAGCKEQWRQIPNEQEHKTTERRNWWSLEPDVGRVAHWVSSRVDRLKGLGNAIVPQVAAELMSFIKTIDDNFKVQNAATD